MQDDSPRLFKRPSRLINRIFYSVFNIFPGVGSLSLDLLSITFDFIFGVASQFTDGSLYFAFNVLSSCLSPIFDRHGLKSLNDSLLPA